MINLDPKSKKRQMRIVLVTIVLTMFIAAGMSYLFNTDRVYTHLFYVPIFIIDIDGLKNINDHFGHSAGDEHIIATSNILHQSLRLGDTLARIGGDEFGIIAQSCGDEGAIDILMRVERQLSIYNETVDTSRWLSISIGFKVNEGSESIQETMLEADRVMYEIKRRKVEVAGEIIKRSV